MALLMAVLVTPPVRGVMTFDTGAGKVHKLSVTQDVTLERGSQNFNSLEYLIVSKHPEYPNKRSLVQFEDLPSSCPSSHVISAKMYLYFQYSHKASFMSIKSVPLFSRYLRVYLVKKPWDNQCHAPPRHPLVFPMASVGRYRRGGNSPARNCHYLSPPTKRFCGV